MRKSVCKNYIYNLIYEIITLLVPLVTTPYISRVLGAEGIGTYSFTYNNAAYFTYFAALGTTVYARREIAYLQDDRIKRSQLFWEVITLRLATTIISTIGYLVFWLLSGRDTIVLIQGIYIIAVFFDITWLFQGMENFGVVVLRNIVIKAVGVIFIFIFVKQRSDLILYIIESAAMPLIGSFILWFGVKKIVSKPDFHHLDIKRHLKGSFALFIPTIAAQVYLLLDKTMIGTISTGSVENGYYEQAQTIIRICWTFVTTFGTVMSPRLAYVFSNKDWSEVRQQMRHSFRVVWFLAIPIALGLISITDSLVPWFFGEEFLSVKVLLYVFSWIVIPVGVNAITGNQYLVATKRQTWYTISVIVGSCSNFILNLILIPRLLSTGAAIASVIAEILIAGVQIYYIVIKLKELSLRDVSNGALRYFVSGGIMMAVNLFVSRFLPSTMCSTLLLVALGTILYIGILLILKDVIVMSGLHKLTGTVKKFIHR